MLKMKTLDAILWPYNTIYLQKADIEYPQAKGTFHVKNNIFLKKSMNSGHLEVSNLIVCYNQLILTAIGEYIKEGKINIDIDFATYKQQVMNHHIVRTDIIFHRPITNNTFKGEVSIDQVKRIHNNYFIKTAINFEEESITGNILLHTKYK